VKAEVEANVRLFKAETGRVPTPAELIRRFPGMKASKRYVQGVLASNSPRPAIIDLQHELQISQNEPISTPRISIEPAQNDTRSISERLEEFLGDHDREARDLKEMMRAEFQVTNMVRASDWNSFSTLKLRAMKMLMDAKKLEQRAEVSVEANKRDPILGLLESYKKREANESDKEAS
jgi:hypothetical protein